MSSELGTVPLHTKTGIRSENVAAKWGISRERQDLEASRAGFLHSPEPEQNSLWHPSCTESLWAVDDESFERTPWQLYPTRRQQQRRRLVQVESCSHDSNAAPANLLAPLNEPCCTRLNTAHCAVYPGWSFQGRDRAREGQGEGRQGECQGGSAGPLVDEVHQTRGCSHSPASLSYVGPGRWLWTPTRDPVQARDLLVQVSLRAR